MGIVAFKWEDGQLTLLQNREQCDSWPIKAAAWDEDEKILRGLPETNNGTWFGISKKGKVAFLVDQMLSNNHNLSLSMLRPVDFLRGEMSPWDYAMQLSQDSAEGEVINKGMIYEMIVADINSSSMFYIAKKDAINKHVHMEEVGFGVHTLTSHLGLNDTLSKSSRMKDLLNEMISDYRDEPVLPIKEMAVRFIYDPAKGDRGFEIPGEEKHFSTMSTIAMVVKPTKEVMFYERYMDEDGKWQEHDLPFTIE